MQWVDMNKKPDKLISVIVPIYKVEDYLVRCVESLLAQSCAQFELILVDDGSPDGCGSICDDYAARDGRIRVIHKANGGLSDARNAGLAAAKGEWIAFVDSDDWVAPAYLGAMLEALETTGADICECGVLRTDGSSVSVPKESGGMSVYETEAALRELIRDGVFHQHVWNKLYRRSCAEGVLFPKGRTNEDEFWTFQVFARAERIVRLDSTLYFYFQRPGSIMGSGYSLKRLDALEAKGERQRFLEQHFPPLADEARLSFFASCVYAGQMSLRCLQGEERRQAVERIDAIQRENRPSAEQLKLLLGTERLWLSMARTNFWGAVQVKKALKKGF